ncbi:MAG: PspC domain-containing protein [Bacillota bacterium]|jgi:phage shock protein C|nr:PspC domain-containing protein [Candidatus Fermentithermobacillaceae bacterium]
MKKLQRSRRLRVIGGVAGGLSEYFDVDVTLVRLAIALLTVMTPNIILAYLLAWIIIPEAPKTDTQPGKAGEISTAPEKRQDRPVAEAGPGTAGGALPPTAAEILASAGIEQTTRPENSDAAVEAEGQEGGAQAPAEPPRSEDATPAAQPAEQKPTVQESRPAAKPIGVDRNKQFFGYLLIVIGALYLLKRHMPSFWFRLPMQFIRTWWPVAIIGIGVVIVLSVIRRDS